jgi:WD40 repeat protein/transcriptional regulator with XRE-family HTH domain
LAEGGTEGFRALALKYRGRTGLSQGALATQAGVHMRSIQGWEAGLNFPSASRLRPLIAAYLKTGGFAKGEELTEARALWAAVMREAPHFETPFDTAWFGELLDEQRTRSAIPVPDQDTKQSENPARHHWGEAPGMANFLGRVTERGVLRRWVLDERCRVVAIVGLGGIGKTFLATRLARDVASAFDYVYWRSLRNAPAPSEWLRGATRFLASGDWPIQEGEAARLERLIGLMQHSRCFLVLDNFESVLQPGERAGRFQPGYEGYGTLLHHLAESPHHSCVLLTSREEPVEVSLLKGDTKPVRVLSLGGLSTEEGQALLRDKQLSGAAETWSAFVTRYGGNGLALRMVGETVRELFGGDIGSFLEARTGVYGGMRPLLDRQFERLTDLEREVVRWLTAEREPVTFADLAADLGPRVGRGAALEAVEGIRRRSMLVRSEQRATFTLQSVVLEYASEQLVDEIVRELENSAPRRLLGQPLLIATGRDYVRRGQERLIAAPVLERLVADRGSPAAAEQRLLGLLDQLRQRPLVEQGYGPGNLVNLLRLLRGDLRRVDLSGLLIRQAYMQEVEAQDASLAGSELEQSVLGEAFTVPNCVALSADGAYVAAGTTAGEVCVWRVTDRQLVLSERGHRGLVVATAISADGGLVASGGLDGSVKLWNIANGGLVATLERPAGQVHGVALSADGRRMAIGGQDGSVGVWDVLSRQFVATLGGHTGPAYGVAVSADGALIACGGYDTSVSFWDAPSGRLLTARQGNAPACGRAVAVSGDGRVVACGSLDGVVRLWEAASGQVVASVSAHSGVVYGVALSADGGLLTSCGQDGTLKLWSVVRHGIDELGTSGAPDASLLATMHGHSGAVLAVALSEHSGALASTGLDGTLRLWSFALREAQDEVRSSREANALLQATLQGHTGVVYGVALCSDGRLLASGSQDAIVRVWEPSSGRLLASLTGHSGVVYGVALSEDGRLLASCGEDETVRLWDLPRGRLSAALHGHTGVVFGVALSGNGRVVASGSQDETARLWDASTGDPLATLRGNTGGVWGVALSEDGTLLATGNLDGAVRLWSVLPQAQDVRRQAQDECSIRGDGVQLLATLVGHIGGIWGVALSRDGRRVAAGGFDGTVKIWSVDRHAMKGETMPLTTLEGHSGGVWGVALSADGGLVVSAGQDGSIRLWDASSGQQLNSLYGPTGLGYGVALSADGTLVACGSFDGTITLWDPRMGTSLRTLRADRRYERVEISGLTGITQAQRAALLAFGAIHTPTTRIQRPQSGARNQ